MTNPEHDTKQMGLARRGIVFGAVAACAAAAGLGLARWTGQWPSTADAGGSKPALWSLDFETPQGTRLAMQSFSGKPLILNFWATWCPPCIEEMPLLDRFFEENKGNGWQVLGVAIDKQAAVIQFLGRNPVRFPIVLAGLSGTDLGRSLGNDNGGLPFTVVFDAGGNVTHRKMGRVTPQELAQWRSSH
jgi:thiol-disulfide isomerase/thioredoxin